MSLTIAKTQTDQNGNIIEVNAPKPLSTGSTFLTTPSLALGDIKNTGIQKANDARIHVCDIVAALNKDIKALKSFISGIIAKIKAAIEALLTALSQNPFVEELKQKVQSLKAKAKLIAQSIKDALDEQSAITEYVTYLKNLINTISNASAEVRKLLQSCLSNAQSDLAIYQGKLNNSSLNTLQTQLNSVNQQVKALA
jgi:predicted  nucleic acid-binding Zn-ribbon protein